MPNWCYNTAEIVANDDDGIRTLKEWAESKEILQSMHPMPEELKYTEGLTEGPNWYDWRVNNWGTKWDIEPSDVVVEGNTLRLSFDSAWAPPTGVYDHLQSLGFTVYASYYEPGMDYAGFYEDGSDRSYDNITEYFRTTDESDWSDDMREVDDIWAIQESLELFDEEYDDA